MFQKARITALEFELDSAMQALGEKEAKILDKESDHKTVETESKKSSKQVVELTNAKKKLEQEIEK